MELESDASGEADLVRIVAAGASAACELYLDRRKCQIVGPYLCFEVAAEMVRAGERVNFEGLAELNFRFRESWSNTRVKGPKIRNCWDDFHPWLERHEPVAAAIFLSYLAEAYAFTSICKMEVGRESLLDTDSAAEMDGPPWLLRAEARRLILQARFALLEGVFIDEALDLLKPASVLCKKLGDKALAARVDALRSATWAEEGYEPWREKGFARLASTLRRAMKLKDGPAVLEISETLAFLQATWRTSQEALQTMEAAADFCARKRIWAPPRLDHLLRLYRALATPSPETVRPLVDEVIEVMSRGDSTWTASLDYLCQVEESLEEESFVALLATTLGEANARSLLEIVHHGHREDAGRRDGAFYRPRWVDREKRSLDDFLAVGG